MTANQPKLTGSGAGCSELTRRIRRMARDGATREAIMASLNVSADRVRRALDLTAPANIDGVDHRRSERKCLRCREPFMSDWIGNRICGGCKTTSGWSLPVQMRGAPFR